jgi:zinc protease
MRAPSRVLAAALGTVLILAAPVAAQVANWPSERPPRPLEPRPVKFPPYQIKTLQNGLQVIAVPHHEQPAVTLRLYVRAGSAQDPADKPGLAALASTLLDQGTTSRSAEQIATAIDSIGGAMGTGSGADLTFATVAVMRNSFDTGLDLLADVARNPAFASDEIDRQRQQILSALQVSREDPDYIAALVFSRLVYGFHPYGRPDTGTEASLQSISREDLLAFHTRWFGGNNAILAIVGDVTPQQAFAGAERAFGTWGGWSGGGEGRRAAAADPARHRRGPPRRGADRDPRGQHRPAAAAPGLPRARPRDQDPRRRGRQPPPSRAALGARAHLRRSGEHRRPQGQRAHRRRHGHPIGNHRRSAAPARRRGRPAAAAARAAA